MKKNGWFMHIKQENLELDVYDEVAAEINKRDVGIQLSIL